MTESLRIQQNAIERFEAFFVNTASVSLSGLTPTITIRRQSDKAYWSGGQDFTSAFTQITMSAIDAVSQGGWYERTFDTTGLADDTYTVIASGTGASNSPLIGEIKVGDYVDNINRPISSIGIGTPAPIINLRGVFTKDEKERLLQLIATNFKQLFDMMGVFHAKLGLVDESVKSSINTSLLELKSKLESLLEYSDLQTKLIQQSEELDALHRELNND